MTKKRKQRLNPLVLDSFNELASAFELIASRFHPGYLLYLVFESETTFRVP